MAEDKKNTDTAQEKNSAASMLEKIYTYYTTESTT